MLIPPMMPTFRIAFLDSGDTTNSYARSSELAGVGTSETILNHRTGTSYDGESKMEKSIERDDEDILGFLSIAS